MSDETKKPTKKKPRRWPLVLAALVISVVLLGAAALLPACTAMGTNAEGVRLARMHASPQWSDEVGSFDNALPERSAPMTEILRRWIAGADNTVPTTPPPVHERSREDLGEPAPSELKLTWLGHSTVLVRIDGATFLIDPVWGERASPFTWAGPKRFHRPPLPLSELPRIDAVVISHDHYDHLDYPTIVELAEKGAMFIVPLGIGAHLEYWGVEPDKIEELDWWDEREIANTRVVCTPSRHFSGRSVTMADRNQTLWAGWAFVGAKHRLFYSGDTAMFPGFREIGKRLGPFDATMMEVGAYNSQWRDVHLGPEQAVLAHEHVKGNVLFPVHWGTFDLALHSWIEPMERLMVAAEAEGVTLVTPEPGETVDALAPEAPRRWWPELPWQTAEEHQVISSGLEPIDTAGSP